MNKHDVPARAALRWWPVLAVALLLAACGGGGSGPAPNAAPAENDLGAHLSTTTLQLQVDVDQLQAPTGSVVSLLVDRLPPSGHYYYSDSATTNAIIAVQDRARPKDYGLDFEFLFAQPGFLGIGNFDDTLTINACLDPSCAFPILGSPFKVQVHLMVGHFAPTESDLPTLPVASSLTPPHDLVDAAYSAALDAVVSVSALPGPALNVLDLATGQTRSVALATVPTALSLAPDGLHAAVGHDGAVSRVTLGPPGTAMTVDRFPVGQAVGEVLFDGQGRVFSFGNQHVNQNEIHVLDLATGIDTARPGDLVYGVAQAVLHPSGSRLYFANENLSPNDIFRISLDGPQPGPVTDSPYHGDYPFCGKVWASPDGQRLYTNCGPVLSASAAADQDMRYLGTLALTGPAGQDLSGYWAVALSVSPDSSEVALLEQSRQTCDPRMNQMASCYTHLGLYAASTLARVALYSLPPVTVGSGRYAQDGRYLFHRNNGRRVVLSQLRHAPDPAAAIRVSLMP